MKKTKERKKEILEAARKVFFDNGYEKTSVDMIADLAGVAKGTVYLYFKSKQQVFMAVTLDIMERFEKVIEKGKNNKENNYHIKLKTMINSTLGFVEANEKFFNIWQKEYRNIGKTFTKAQHKKLEERHRMMMGVFSEVVQEGINKGLIRKVNPAVAGVILLTMITTFSSLDIFTTDKKVLNKKSTEIMDIFLKGVGK